MASSPGNNKMNVPGRTIQMLKFTWLGSISSQKLLARYEIGIPITNDIPRIFKNFPGNKKASLKILIAEKALYLKIFLIPVLR